MKRRESLRDIHLVNNCYHMSIDQFMLISHNGKETLLLKQKIERGMCRRSFPKVISILFEEKFI